MSLDSSISLFSKMTGFIRPYWKETFLSIFLSTATIAANIGMMGTSAYLIATAALQPSIAVLQVAIVGVRFFGIARGVFRYLERLVSHSVNFRVLGNIRGWFYRVIEPLIPGAVEDLHEGDLLGRSLQDIESLEDFYVRGIAPPLSAIVITVAVSLFTMQYSMLMAGILAFGLLSTGLVLTILVKIFSANIARQVVQTRSTLTGLVVETINGSAEILMNNADTRYLEKVGLAIDSNRQTSLRLGNLQAVSQASGVLISNLTLAAMLWAGIPLVTSGTIDCVILAVLTLITLASFEPVNLLPAASSKIETSLAAAQRLFELADRPRPVQEPAQSTNLTEFQSLRVIDLDFSYAGTDFKVLRGINLNLHPGKHVALVGPSSSGKTTLLRILQHHLQPPEGTVFWNGLDAKNLNSHTIQSLQAVVQQKGYLFNATLLENFKLANPDISETEIHAVLDQTGMDGWFASLENGLHYPLGENGSSISGGERQRLLLARGLLMRKPVFLADEPFSNVDRASDKQLVRAIFESGGNMAIILATHRLVCMDLFDEILVLDSGQVIQSGRHEELISLPGLYRTLWEQQNNFFGFE